MTRRTILLSLEQVSNHFSYADEITAEETVPTAFLTSKPPVPKKMTVCRLFKTSITSNHFLQKASLTAFLRDCSFYALCYEGGDYKTLPILATTLIVQGDQPFSVESVTLTHPHVQKTGDI